MKLTEVSIGFVGLGNMASAMIHGLIQTKIRSDQIWGYDSLAEKTKQAQKSYQVKGCLTLKELVEHSSIIVVAVKPQNFDAVLDQIALLINQQANSKLIVSIAAGVQLSQMQVKLKQASVFCLRMMPNLAVRYQKGCSAYFFDPISSQERSNEQKTLVSLWVELLETLGMAQKLVKEDDFDVFTAIAGSGPAFFYRYFQAMIEAAKKLGYAEDSSKIIHQTILGAMEHWQQSQMPVKELIYQVASPGGTTQAGLDSLDQTDFDQAINECVKKAAARSKELSDLMKNKK